MDYSQLVFSFFLVLSVVSAGQSSLVAMLTQKLESLLLILQSDMATNLVRQRNIFSLTFFFRLKQNQKIHVLGSDSSNLTGH